MTKNERERLIKALDHLEQNPCEWEDAMALLYPLAGFEYHDLRKIKGTGVSVTSIGGVQVPNIENQTALESLSVTPESES